jgi:hypothetical protein
VAPRVGAALATPFSRFERLTILKTPGFAGGWLFVLDVVGCSQQNRQRSLQSCHQYN